MNKKRFLILFLIVVLSFYLFSINDLFLDSNKSKIEYFRNTSIISSDGKDRVRFVVMVGIPGSGKSFWSSFADSRWTKISYDDERVNILSQKSAKLEKSAGNMYHSGIDPLPSANKKLVEALKSNRPIILDTMAITFLRSKNFIIAREHGYFIDALVFNSIDISNNSDNIKYRKMNGGIDLVDDINDHQRRLEILNELQIKMNNNPLKVLPDTFTNFDIHSFTMTSNMDSQLLIKNDFVNRIKSIDVKNYSGK